MRELFSDSMGDHIIALAEAISAETGVTTEAILGRTHAKTASAARRRLMTKLWLEGLSYTEIGGLLDRNHCTVMAGVRKELGAHPKRARVAA